MLHYLSNHSSRDNNLMLKKIRESIIYNYTQSTMINIVLHYNFAFCIINPYVTLVYMISLCFTILSLKNKRECFTMLYIKLHYYIKWYIIDQNNALLFRKNYWLQFPLQKKMEFEPSSFPLKGESLTAPPPRSFSI